MNSHSRLAGMLFKQHLRAPPVGQVLVQDYLESFAHPVHLELLFPFER
jgi:hypothetical protein